MAKLKGPLASFNASGRLTAGLTYLRRRFTNIVEREPQPKDTKSFAQLSWRHMYQKAVALWNALDAVEKLSWESLARPFHMTGFAYFISQALKPNPGLYLPLQGGKMSGEIDMNGHRIEDVPDPTLAQDPVTLQYFEDNLPAGGYDEGARVYHNAHQELASGIATALAFNSERYDTDTIHDTVVNNSRLTCKTAGVYVMSGCVLWTDGVVGYRALAFRLNGATGLGSVKLIASPNYVTCSISTIYKLAINDYVELMATHSQGAPISVYYSPNQSPEFSMSRVGVG